MDPMLYDIMGSDGGEFQTSTKTEDEIKKLTLEDGMTETKRTVYILSRGQPIQKLSIYLNLHRILLEPEGFTKIFPLLSEEVLNQTEEAQSEAAKSLIKLINNTELDKSCYYQIFKLLLNIINVWAQPVLDNWANLFGVLLKKLPYSSFNKECEEKLLSLSEASQHGMSKYVAARMIGYIADSGVSSAGLLYDRCKMLCLDADVEVRRILASEVMGRICRAVGTELAENKFMGKILELLYSQDIITKLSALETIMSILDVLSEEYFDARLLTVFVDLTSSVNEEVMKRISFHIGNIIYRLESTLEKNKTQMAQIQNTYKEWGLHKNAEVRKNVIYNLPYMIRICDNRDYLKSLYLKALKENDKNIRFTAISCLHEMSKFMGAEDANSTYREIFENALKENDTRLNDKLTKNFHLIVAVMQYGTDEEVKESPKDMKISINGKDSTPKEYPNTFPAVINLGENIANSNNWRLELVYIENLQKCIEYFDIREIAEKYVNYLMARLAKGVDVIRNLIQDCLVNFLYKNYISSINANILKRIAAEFHASTNYQNRLTFLNLYAKLAERFSRTYFKFFNLNDMALNLALDKVPSVRRRFLSIAVVLRKMIFQDDDKLISKLEDAISKLLNVKEKDIAKEALEVHRELKSLTSYYFEDFEPEDARRLEREKEQEAEEIKKKQMEEQKDRAGDYLDSYGSRLSKYPYGGKKDPKATPSSGSGPKVSRNSLMIPSTNPKIKYEPATTTTSSSVIKGRSQTTITGPTLNGTTGQTSTRKKSDSLTDVEKKSPISGKKETPNLGTIKIGEKTEKIEIPTVTKTDSKASNTNKENNSKGSKDTKSVMTTISVKKK